LFLQCLAQIRPHLLRPPELAQELVSLCQEGNLEEAGNAAQSDDSMLGVVATAALSNIDRGKQSMQEAMQEAGDIESQKYVFRIGMLQLIGAVAPMLGLTGTTLGMIKTFAVIGKKADAVSPSDMAIGISEALICTFLGLMVAIPLIIGSYFLKGRLNQTTMEVANDVNEMIRASSPQENA
jgi:biopolymer transport protein ExbB